MIIFDCDQLKNLEIKPVKRRKNPKVKNEITFFDIVIF